MQVVLVFKKKILGYGFECEEGELVYESILIRDRLDRYLMDNYIQKRSFAEKYESLGKVYKGFIGFLEEDIPVFSRNLEEAEVETGKYLKFGNLYCEDDLRERFCVNKKIQIYMEENNIRTDWMRFSFGKNSYLRIIN